MRPHSGLEAHMAQSQRKRQDEDDQCRQHRGHAAEHPQPFAAVADPLRAALSSPKVKSSPVKSANSRQGAGRTSNGTASFSQRSTTSEPSTTNSMLSTCSAARGAAVTRSASCSWS
jgi:hypothetical protein